MSCFFLKRGVSLFNGSYTHLSDTWLILMLSLRQQSIKNNGQWDMNKTTFNFSLIFDHNLSYTLMAILFSPLLASFLVEFALTKIWHLIFFFLLVIFAIFDAAFSKASQQLNTDSFIKYYKNQNLWEDSR